MATVVATGAVANERSVSGWIKSDQNQVKVGDTPNVSWGATITLPEVVDVHDDTVEALKRVRMDVRVLSASFTAHWSGGWSWVNIVGMINHGKGWNQIFLGIHPEINQSAVVMSQIIEKGQTVNMASNFYNPFTNNWMTWRISGTGSPHVLALRNGDPVPRATPAVSFQDAIEDILSPYMSADTGLVTIGPRDVIYLFDFNNPGEVSFDMQDFVALLTFTEVE